MTSLSHHHQAVRPTVLVGVPRVWEKFKEKVEAQLSQVTGFKEVIMSKARSVGRQTSINRQSGRPTAWGYWLANTSVTVFLTRWFFLKLVKLFFTKNVSESTQ